MSLKQVRSIIKKHKILSGLALIVIVGGVYFFTKGSAAKATVRYVTSPAMTGTLVSSVTGSGQVSAEDQVDVKPQVSGAVTKVSVTVGQAVKKGDVIAYLDATDAYKSVRDAQISLQSAQLSYQKATEPISALSLTQAENALTQAQQNLQSSTNNLTKAYEDGFTSISNAYIDLPAVMAGINTDLFSTGIVNTQWNIDYYSDAIKDTDLDMVNYRNDVQQSYQTAQDALTASFNDYKTMSRSSDNATIKTALSETYATAKDVSAALKSASTFIQFYKDRITAHTGHYNPAADAALNDLSSYTQKIDSHLSDLLSAQTTLQNDKNAITNANESITEKTESLAQLQAGPDTLDLQSEQLGLEQKQTALSDAQSQLAKYVLRAPIDGVVASVGLKVGDQAGSGTTAATIVSHGQLAIISLNEVDAAKVSVGQKVTLTFDAIDGLSLTGEVTQVDTLGTVSQGVVTYNVQIGFDSQDSRIKSSMSVTAAVITDVKQNVLLVPNSAVTLGAQGTNVGTVQVLVNGQPTAHTVTVVGANDSSTAVSGDIAEGDLVVTQTITGTPTAAAATGGTSALGALGGGRATFGGGGGGFRGGGGGAPTVLVGKGG